jgi:ribosomal protein S6
MSEANNMETNIEVTNAEGLSIYELGFLLLSTIAAEQVEGVVAKIRAILADHKAVIIEEGAASMLALAYTMDKVIETKRQKFDHAYFGWIKFEVESSEVGSIKSKVDALSEVLRTLFVTTLRENTMISGKIAAEEAAIEAKEADAEAGVVEDAPIVTEEEVEKLSASVA